jgi:hypothetical protein
MALTYEQVREWALALPGTSEVMVEAWGHPTLRVNDKKFAGGGPGLPSVTVKASMEEQAELVARDPKTYSPAAYVGRYGWVEISLATADPGELRELLIESWRRIAPKKLVAEYETR